MGEHAWRQSKFSKLRSIPKPIMLTSRSEPTPPPLIDSTFLGARILFIEAAPAQEASCAGACSHTFFFRRFGFLIAVGVYSWGGKVHKRQVSMKTRRSHSKVMLPEHADSRSESGFFG